jgi:hypothetical protein
MLVVTISQDCARIVGRRKLTGQALKMDKIDRKRRRKNITEHKTGLWSVIPHHDTKENKFHKKVKKK